MAHEVIGDLDSLSCLPQKEVLIHRFPKNKDKTDGELSFKFSKKKEVFFGLCCGSFWRKI